MGSWTPFSPKATETAFVRSLQQIGDTDSNDLSMFMGLSDYLVDRWKRIAQGAGRK